MIWIARAVAWYRHWRIRRAMIFLQHLDGWMRQAGYTRRETRQFWRDLAKQAKHREELFERLR